MQKDLGLLLNKTLGWYLQKKTTHMHNFQKKITTFKNTQMAQVVSTVSRQYRRGTLHFKTTFHVHSAWFMWSIICLNICTSVYCKGTKSYFIMKRKECISKVFGKNGAKAPFPEVLLLLLSKAAETYIKHLKRNVTYFQAVTVARRPAGTRKYIRPLPTRPMPGAQTRTHRQDGWRCSLFSGLILTKSHLFKKGKIIY